MLQNKQRRIQFFRKRDCLYIIILVITLIVALRSFERMSIWNPSSTINETPAKFSLHYEDVALTSADGTRLHGWFLPADNPRAAVLFCHGNSGNISHFTTRICLFHEMGFSTLTFDYRGYGQSEGWLSEEGTYLDTLAALQWLKEREPVIPLVVYGWSLGAALAIDVASKADADMLVCESAFANTQLMARDRFPRLSKIYTPSIRYDSLAKMPQINIPAMFIHSRDDYVIPFHHSQRLVTAAQEPKLHLELDGGHNSVATSRQLFIDAFEKFFQKHVLKISLTSIQTEGNS